ncbi:MAG TPA: nucleotidyl transferase AbiEii/AbiGii toxin family protein [Planctomycetota bacterium]|nr:nucleotidyl transferase AbiEii/AbiGii toxin family protein [Planctomycetota bacterium]
MSGKTTGLAATARRALQAIRRSRVPYCVIGATALAVRGLPRMTRDIDLTVTTEHGLAAIEALKKAGFETLSADSEGDDPMVIFRDRKTGVEVDLLIAAGNPEALAIEEAGRKSVFGTSARVATLEHLLLLYLYSNQPRHLGDFASIVQSGRADLVSAERQLFEMHPEMCPAFRQRVQAALHPASSPPKPRHKR